MIRTIAAALAAFALVSFSAVADEAAPADKKADAKMDKKAHKKGKKAKKAAAEKPADAAPAK